MINWIKKLFSTSKTEEKTNDLENTKNEIIDDIGVLAPIIENKLEDRPKLDTLEKSEDQVNENKPVKKKSKVSKDTATKSSTKNKKSQSTTKKK